MSQPADGIGPETAQRPAGILADLPGPMRRRGPRPLLLHLMLARQSPGSNGAWPNWNAGWPPADLAADPALIAGIAAYRRHPSRRDLIDPPTIWREGGSRLLDFGRGDARLAALFVPSLINRSHILDLTERRSLLRFLSAHGVRPLLLDWGWPGETERDFSLTDYVAGRLERAIASVPGPLVLAGYCMGGLLALAAALRHAASDRGKVAGLALLATPWDFHAGDGGAVGRSVAATLAALEPVLAATGTMPVDVIQTLFAFADGGGVAGRYRGFAALDQESERARAFVALEDWLNDGVPLPAPVARECLGGWYGRNTPARGLWRVAGQVVTPEALGCPVFLAWPERDRIVPPASAQALAARLSGARVMTSAAGHIGMVVGSGAPAGLWSGLLAWLRGL